MNHNVDMTAVAEAKAAEKAATEAYREAERQAVLEFDRQTGIRHNAVIDAVYRGDVKRYVVRHVQVVKWLRSPEFWLSVRPLTKKGDIAKIGSVDITPADVVRVVSYVTEEDWRR